MSQNQVPTVTANTADENSCAGVIGNNNQNGGNGQNDGNQADVFRNNGQNVQSGQNGDLPGSDPLGCHLTDPFNEPESSAIDDFADFSFGDDRYPSEGLDGVSGPPIDPYSGWPSSIAQGQNSHADSGVSENNYQVGEPHSQRGWPSGNNHSNSGVAEDDAQADSAHAQNGVPSNSGANNHVNPSHGGNHSQSSGPHAQNRSLPSEPVFALRVEYDFNRNPYQARANEIGRRHLIPIIETLHSHLEPPGWTEGNPPINEQQAHTLFQQEREKAEKAASEFFDADPNHQIEDGLMLKWRMDFYHVADLHRLVLIERLEIFRHWLQRQQPPTELDQPHVLPERNRYPYIPLNPPDMQNSTDPSMLGPHDAWEAVVAAGLEYTEEKREYERRLAAIERDETHRDRAELDSYRALLKNRKDEKSSAWMAARLHYGPRAELVSAQHASAQNNPAVTFPRHEPFQTASATNQQLAPYSGPSYLQSNIGNNTATTYQGPNQVDDLTTAFGQSELTHNPAAAFPEPSQVFSSVSAHNQPGQTNNSAAAYQQPSQVQNATRAGNTGYQSYPGNGYMQAGLVNDPAAYPQPSQIQNTARAGNLGYQPYTGNGYMQPRLVNIPAAYPQPSQVQNAAQVGNHGYQSYQGPSYMQHGQVHSPAAAFPPAGQVQHRGRVGNIGFEWYGESGATLANEAGKTKRTASVILTKCNTGLINKQKTKAKSTPTKKKLWYQDELESANLPTSEISPDALQAGRDWKRMDDERRAVAAAQQETPTKKRRRGPKPVPSAEDGLKISYDTARKMVAAGVPNNSEVLQAPQDPHVVPMPPKTLNTIVPPSSGHGKAIEAMTVGQPMYPGGQFGYCGNPARFLLPAGNAGTMQATNQSQMFNNHNQSSDGQANNNLATIGNQTGASNQPGAPRNDQDIPYLNDEFDVNESSPEEPDDSNDETYGSKRRKSRQAKRGRRR